MSKVLSVAVVLLGLSCNVFAGEVDVSGLRVVEPSAEVVEQLGLEGFYAKCVMVDGFAIISSGKVDDYALLEAGYLIKTMLKGRGDILRMLAANKVRFVVMGYDEVTTDVPEHSDLRPGKFWDKRARGLGATPRRPATSCGEENLLCYKGDPYGTENILVHEFAHTIHHMGLNYIDKGFDVKLKAAYEDAMGKGLWKGKYAGTNRAEYWAEAVQSYFDDNRQPDHDHNHVNTRKELFEYDPALAGLVEEVFGDHPWRYKKPALRDEAGTKHLKGYSGKNAPTFSWSAELVKWYRDYEAEKRKEKEERRKGSNRE